MKLQATYTIRQLNLLLMAGLIIVLPFAADQSLMFPTQSAKFILFGLTVIAIVSLFFIVNIFTNPARHFRLSGPDLALTAYFIYTALCVLINANRYGSSERFRELTGLAALYMVLRRWNARSFRFLFVALLLSGAAQAVYGNLQLYGVFPSHHNLFRITGGFFNPGPYAGFLAVIFPAALTFYLYAYFTGKDSDPNAVLLKGIKISPTLILQYIAAIAAISIVLVLPATRSRAAWLAVIVASVFILIRRYKLLETVKTRLKKPVLRITATALFVILTGFAVAGLYVMKKGSADGRLLIWKVTARMIGHRPLFGYGYNRFMAVYPNYQATYFDTSGSAKEAIVADDTTRAFNEYLQLMAEQGLIGLALILAAGWLVFYQKQAGKENVRDANSVYASKMGLLAFGVFAFFSYPSEILPVKLIVTLYLARLALNSNPLFILTVPEKAIRPAVIAMSITGLAVSLSLAGPVLKKYDDYRLWLRAYMTYQAGGYESSVSQYENIYNGLKYNGRFLVNYGKACSMAGRHEQALRMLRRAEDFLPNTIVYTALGDSYKALGKADKAEQAYLKASRILPDRFYPKYLLAKLYDETGRQAMAVKTAHDLLNKNIKINSMAVQEIKAEMKAIVDKAKLIKNE